MKRSTSNGLYRKLLSGIFCLALFTGSFAALAQKKNGAGGGSQTKTAAAAKCSGAWTGVINYTRAQSKTDSKTVERVSGRGRDTTDWQMKYNYKAGISVTEAPEKNGTSVGKAQISHSFSSIEKVSAIERNSCDRGKTWRDMRGESVSISEATAHGKEEADVSIGVNADGTYTVSVGLPEIKGKLTGSQSASFSGQCTPKEGKNFSLPPTETIVEGNRFASDGSHRIDPANPNRISGSYTFTQYGVTETITWNLQKCGAELRLLAVEFEDMKFPDWNAWQAISEQKGTIDGNLVKIKAKILNASGETKFADVKFKETYKGDRWNAARPDGLLEGGEISVRLEAGEEKEVEMVWDSSGYAWFDNGRPRLVQPIKAELEENGKKIDEQTKNLKVAPKPVVLVHGLWSNWKAWETWQEILTAAHSRDWKAYAVGEKPEKGLMNTGGSFLSTDPTNSIFENSLQLAKYIRYAQEDRNAWHVDLVAHSMGGLISRSYIHQLMPVNSPDGRPQIAHLVMLGTPNMGSPCADMMNFAFEFLDKNVEAVRQLRQDVVADFNKVHTNRKGVKFSVLAGDPLPSMCKTVVWNDGVVPVPSAMWKIQDNALSKSVHTSLTGTKDFSDFVKPRLAIGPKGNHAPEAPELPQFPGQVGARTYEAFSPYFVKASYAPEIAVENFSDADLYKPDFVKEVKLAARQAVEIEIPVEDAKNFGITMMADAGISATLFDAKGAVAGKNAANSPEAKAFFRSIFVEKTVSAGVWKIKLENTSGQELSAVLAVWKNAQ